MRETLVHILSQMLANNIGQRLTPELATGIANTFDRAVVEVQAQNASTAEAPELFTETQPY